MINFRPITYVSEDKKDPVYLVSMMFLQDFPNSGVPDIDTLYFKDLNRRAKYLWKFWNDLRNRFGSEYLGQLHQHAFKKENSKELQVGNIVLLEDGIKRRIDVKS